MSKATTLGTQLRESHYLAQTGRQDLTPAQRRRSRHKQNDMIRPTARVGRLRRRYDRKDQAAVRAAALAHVQRVRSWVTFNRHASKKRSTS